MVNEVEVIVLRCPNCGALIKREKNKCEYCGAELILTSGGSFSFRFQSVCPSCGNINEKSSWFCVNCKKILTTDIDMLKELQKKEFLMRLKIKYSIPFWMMEKLEDDEFVYHVFSSRIKGEDEFYVVTDKRIMKRYEEVPLGEALSVSKPKFGSSFEVSTLDKDIVFEFDNALDCELFRANVKAAIENHDLKKKDIRVLLSQLQLGQEEKFKKIAMEKEMRFIDDLLKKLLDRYMSIYGNHRLAERKIKSLMKEGLSREKAIRKLAIKEDLIE